MLFPLLIVSLCMRAPILAIAPVISQIRSALHIDAATAGLLTTIPVLCFGLGTPAVLLIVRRYGLDRAVLIMLGGILAGVLVRPAGGLALAFTGTLIIGLAITVGNVVAPVIIGRDFPGRAPSITAAYSSALNIGSMIATTISAPLAGWLGWRTSLASWAVLALLGAAFWQLRMQRYPETARDAGPLSAAQEAAALQSHVPLWRRTLVIGMVLAFAGQSFSYYGISAWLPSLLADELGESANSAGASSSIFQILAIIGAFAVPALVAARMPARGILLVLAAGWLALPIGLATAPSLWALWCVFGGIAQGGVFTVIFSVVVARAADLRDSRRMSAAVQGVGYCVGATGPFVLGWAHTLSGGWLAPLLVVVTALAIMTLSGLAAVGSGQHS